MSIFFQTAGYQHLPAPCDLLSKFLVSLVSEHHAEDALSNTSLRCPHPVSKRALFSSASGWTSIGPLRVFFDSRKLVEKHHPSTAWCLTQWIGYSFPHHLMGLMTFSLEFVAHPRLHQPVKDQTKLQPSTTSCPPFGCFVLQVSYASVWQVRSTSGHHEKS